MCDHVFSPNWCFAKMNNVEVALSLNMLIDQEKLIIFVIFINHVRDLSY